MNLLRSLWFYLCIPWFILCVIWWILTDDTLYEGGEEQLWL